MYAATNTPYPILPCPALGLCCCLAAAFVLPALRFGHPAVQPPCGLVTLPSSRQRTSSDQLVDVLALQLLHEPLNISSIGLNTDCRNTTAEAEQQRGADTPERKGT